MNTPFAGRMKLAELIAENHNLILMLPRFGIPLGFGEKSVQDVCQAHGVPTDFFLLICNVYTFDDYQPDLEGVDMSPLASYLEASHRYYLRERLPHIGQHLHRIASQAGAQYGPVLERFYADYQAEVEAHFRLEEEEVFPLLATRRKPSTLNFEESHETLIDKLGDLTQIAYKYLPGNQLPEETMELVFDILQLSADLEKHALIEEKILLPYLR